AARWREDEEVCGSRPEDAAGTEPDGLRTGTPRDQSRACEDEQDQRADEDDATREEDPLRLLRQRQEAMARVVVVALDTRVDERHHVAGGRIQRLLPSVQRSAQR